MRWYSGSRDILLVRARVVVEHVEERLDVQLREDARCAKQRVWHLRVVRRCLYGIPGYVVLRPRVKCDGLARRTTAHLDSVTHFSVS